MTLRGSMVATQRRCVSGVHGEERTALGLPVMWLLADLKVMEKPGTVWMLAELGAYG